jgi:predicted glycogen debranching enzyme
MIHFGPDICHNVEAAVQREWLETNGLGGFASSTILGLNTRRYHGLLTAAIRPPVGRLVLLAKLEETLIVDGQRFDLSANQYPGVIHPQGQQHLQRFRLDPFPVFTYTVAHLELEKSVFMVHGENTTVIQYAVRATSGDASPHPQRCQLEVRPLMAFRDYHSTTHRNDALDTRVQMETTLATVAPYGGLPALHCAHDADTIDPVGEWYDHFEYAVERERGFDDWEDLFNPFVLRFDLRQRAQAAIIASTERRDIRCAPAYRQAETARRQAMLAAAPSSDDLVRTLVAAADQYIVSRGQHQTVIAGYHWFSDWGRDTMIALPGLTLVTGRVEVAKSLLLTFAQHVDRGMLPNRFPDAGATPEYNTVDAALWFFEAIRAVWQRTGDDAWLRQLYDVLTDIIAWHVQGTRYGIGMDEDGLLRAGEDGVQLTWMDVKIGDWVVTPRRGKPVEIQALWYNALRLMAQWAHTQGDAAGQQRYGTLADQAGQSFNRLFWHEAADCLYDVVDGDTRDGAIRPNQILAVSLPYSMLAPETAQRVVATVERELLTPYGLRSLSPHDPHYRGRYEGDPASRDATYHQGTVWAWLMGPFITAYLRVSGDTEAARQQARQWLTGFRTHLHHAGLGHIAEIFDGDAPHQPRGCIAQAWSVAEVLRVAAALGLLNAAGVADLLPDIAA